MGLGQDILASHLTFQEGTNTDIMPLDVLDTGTITSIIYVDLIQP